MLVYVQFYQSLCLTGMHLWRGVYSPFIRYAQAKLCHRIIVVPLSTFHRLAELIGDPKGELIFLFNTARCGGTLLTQVKCVSDFSAVPNLCSSKHYTNTVNLPDAVSLVEAYDGGR